MDLGSRAMPLESVRVLVLGDTPVMGVLQKLLGEQGATITRVPKKLTVGKNPVAYEGLTAIGSQDFAEATPNESCSTEQLISRSDVLVDGFGPDALGQLGFGTMRLAELQPSLIYCVLSSLPEAAGCGAREVEDWVAAAELGLFRAGSSEPDSKILPIVNGYTAVQAALYIVAALRRMTNELVVIEVSLFGASVLALSSELMRMNPPGTNSKIDRFRFPIYNQYLCADGRYVQIYAQKRSVCAGILNAIGHPDWIEDVLDGINNGLDNKGTQELWLKRLTDVFLQRPAWEWESRISATGGCCTVCRTRDEWRAEQHALDTEIFVPSAQTSHLTVGSSIRVFSSPRSDVAGTSLDSGTATTTPARPTEEFPIYPLEGTRVLDLSIILAGPTCGRILAEFGADVVKIDTPERDAGPYSRTLDGFRQDSSRAWLNANRTKRSILLDLKTPRGKSVLWRLIDSADVVLENYRTGKLAELGFGFEEVASRKPGIVYVCLNAYDHGGEFSNRPGWESVAQAMTGMHLAQGSQGRPASAAVFLNDYGTGYLGAFGTMIALREANRTGQSQLVLGSLARTASFLQSLEFESPDLGTVNQKNAGIALPQIEFAEFAEGWIAYNASRALDIGMYPPDSLEALVRGGVPHAHARLMDEIQTVDWVREAGFVKSWNHPHWGRMTHVFESADASSFQQRQGWPAPDPGDDSVAILSDVGYSAGEIRRLLRDDVIVERIPLFRNLPSGGNL